MKKDTSLPLSDEEKNRAFEKARIWMRGASYEVLPGEADKIQKLSLKLKPGTEISVIHLPDKDYRENTDVARKILNAGFLPVPHLAARYLRDEKQLKEIAESFREIGVKNLLLIGGGLNVQKGKFKTVSDLLKTGILEDCGIEKFAIAGHPEKHPFASDKEIMTAYESKFRYFRDAKKDVCVITQFTFSARRLIDLAEKLASSGLDFPIRVGVPGVCNFPVLLKYAKFCGVGNSIGILKKEAAKSIALTKGYDPVNFLTQLSELLLSPEVSPNAKKAIEGIHVFPFGNHEKTIDRFATFASEET